MTAHDGTDHEREALRHLVAARREALDAAEEHLRVLDELAASAAPTAPTAPTVTVADTLSVLRDSIRTSGLSIRSLSERLDMDYTGLTQRLKGKREGYYLRTDTLLGILAAINVAPSSFFAEVERSSAARVDRDVSAR
ncbi:hypothetical protein [Agromyces kandeliae]|uniref:HTH cro/C1-type domain-containing protein n=1 Tax=Agromyces kandeliae TaxID=2666141 RepID=A0A6L5QX49_9MICO|nr:hypothetical protein [Agromyces kandeliae]MRX42341.1 hypothetical protein [Agromyces kandeliae]